jgi:hypothetical protein
MYENKINYRNNTPKDRKEGNSSFNGLSIAKTVDSKKKRSVYGVIASYKINRKYYAAYVPRRSVLDVRVNVTWCKYRMIKSWAPVVTSTVYRCRRQCQETCVPRIEIRINLIAKEYFQDRRLELS